MSHPNTSTALARVVVDELIRHGVGRVVLAPGSRSSALAIAVAERDELDLVVHLDERSAAFRALGQSLVTGIPTAVVTTSGSAVANLMPAVVEADQSSVPLLLMTADRPEALVRRRANQTMVQPGIFGRYVRRSENLPWPEETSDQNDVWRSTASRAFRATTGSAGRPGPVHLNIAFNEPTLPVGDDGRTSGPSYDFPTHGRPSGEPWETAGESTARDAALSVDFGPRPLVIAGRGAYDPIGLMDLAVEKQLTVLATAQSMCRSEQTVDSYHHLMVDGIPEGMSPTSVVVVGQIGPSDRLQELTRAGTPVIHVDPWSDHRDPLGTATHTLVAFPGEVLSQVGTGDAAFRDEWLETARKMRSALAELLIEERQASGPAVARVLGRTKHQALVVGSSLAIRDVDAYAQTPGPVYSNRGLSGIDGFVSTALGVADAASGALAMTGDLTFLHDSNGLLADPRSALTVVVVDNNGGGLFDLLPHSRHTDEFERLFITPQNRDLAKLAAFHGAGYSRVENVDSLAAVVDGSLGGTDVVVVHVPVERSHDLAVRTASDRVARRVLSERR